MTKEQLEEINKVAEIISREFIVSNEDNANPFVKVAKDKVFIYAGHALEDGEYIQQLYTTIELNKYDIEELLQNAEGWLLSEVFREFFISITTAEPIKKITDKGVDDYLNSQEYQDVLKKIDLSLNNS